MLLLSEWCTVKFYTLLPNVRVARPACVMQNQIAGIHGKHCSLQARATHVHQWLITKGSQAEMHVQTMKPFALLATTVAEAL